MVRYLFCPRGLLMLAVIAAACTFTTLSQVHHHADGVFNQLFAHLKPAPLLSGGQEIALHLPWLPSLFTMNSDGVDTDKFVVTNLQVFQVTAVLVILIGFSGVAAYLRTGKGDVWSKMFAGFVGFVRDEMVYPNMGKEHGHHFVPFFLCLFFFVMFQNMFGLLPNSATATASIAVTCALALVTFGSMLGCGMVAQGPIRFWKNLVPHVPLALWPLLFVIELIGLCVKPFALMIRLFANMTAGHLIVLSCMGLIMFFADEGKSQLVGYGSAPLCIAFAVFIMIIETFVAVLQAYIFTTLSIIFVGASVHPEH